MSMWYNWLDEAVGKQSYYNTPLVNYVGTECSKHGMEG